MVEKTLLQRHLSTSRQRLTAQNEQKDRETQRRIQTPFRTADQQSEVLGWDINEGFYMSKDFFETVGKEVANRPHRGRSEIGAEMPLTAGTPVIMGEGAKRSWAEADGNFWGTPQSHDRLPTGIYRMEINGQVGPMFSRQKNDTDDLVELPDSESAKILSEIRQFKTLRESFREHGFLYKRGILMYGPPGSGKTCTLQLLLKMLVDEHDSIAVLVETPHVAATCLQSLRRIEPERQIVAILEDLDALCERYGESEYLALLDGESQIDNVVYVATTNYPERLDRRFVDRPSRFDTIREIGMPTDAARRTYLEKKVPELKPHGISEYVNMSKGYSIAHLRELIILTRCFDVPLEVAAKRLDESRHKKHSSDNTTGKVIGF